MLRLMRIEARSAAKVAAPKSAARGQRRGAGAGDERLRGEDALPVGLADDPEAQPAETRLPANACK